MNFFVTVLVLLTILNAATYARATDTTSDKTSYKITDKTSDETTTAAIPDIDVAQIPVQESRSPVLMSKKSLSASLAVEYSSDLKKEDDPTKQKSTSIILAPVYTINSKSSLEGRIDFIQELQGETKSRFSNFILIGTPYTFDLKKEVLTFKPKLGVTAPTDDVAYNDDAYRGSISFRPTFTWTVQQMKGLTLSNITYLTQNFHEFEVKRNGSANTEYSLRNRVTIGYGFTDRLSLELINDYARGWSYNGFAKDSFYFGQKLGYEVIQSWQLAVSHTNEGGARSANNSNNNVEVFDQKSSTVAVEISKEF